MKHGTCRIGATAFCFVAMMLLPLGCGPLTMPMVIRLDEEGQQRVDHAWENLSAQIGSVDRTLLLDAMITSQMFQLGVDRLDMTSSKTVPNGRVTMEIHFNRYKPEADRFVFAYVNTRARLKRVETYAADEVKERFEFLYGRNGVTTGRGESRPADDAKAAEAGMAAAKEHQQAVDDRLAQVSALLDMEVQPHEPTTKPR